jgi:hypothetical protein
MCKKVEFIILALLFLTAFTSVQAAVLLYEPFDYTLGQGINGKNGGTGFSAGWVMTVAPPAGYTVSDPIVNGLDSSLGASGNAMYMVAGNSTVACRHYESDIAEGTTWFSVLIRADETTNNITDANGKVRFNAWNTSNRGYGLSFSFTKGTGYSFWAAVANTKSTTAKTVEVLSGTSTVLVIGKVVKTGDSAAVDLWVNPADFSSETALGTAHSTMASTSMNTGTNDPDGLSVKNSEVVDNQHFTVDEIVVANALEDLLNVAGLPYNPTPVNGADRELTTLSTLSWKNPDAITDPNFGGDPNFPRYDLYMGITEPNFAAANFGWGTPLVTNVPSTLGGVVNQSLSGIWTLPLINYQQYYWIVVLNNAGPSDIQGPVWTFTVNENIKPVVNAGPDVYIWANSLTDPNAIAVINATVTDTDGPSALTYAWTRVGTIPAGGSVVFNPNNSEDTSATVKFISDTAGNYTLRLTVSDGVDTVSDDVNVIVKSNACVAAKAVTTPAYVDINGDVNDDCKVDLLDLASMVADWLECNSLVCL